MVMSERWINPMLVGASAHLPRERLHGALRWRKAVQRHSTIGPRHLKAQAR
jgi:hypothetical protein